MNFCEFKRFSVFVGSCETEFCGEYGKLDGYVAMVTL